MARKANLRAPGACMYCRRGWRTFGFEFCLSLRFGDSDSDSKVLCKDVAKITFSVLKIESEDCMVKKTPSHSYLRRDRLPVILRSASASDPPLSSIRLCPEFMMASHIASLQRSPAYSLFCLWSTRWQWP
jgi:hypothetical protein